MITVVIPALNEEKTIGSVVKFCLADSNVSQVIVVDDQSEDRTREIAKDAGAEVIISQTRGKGISMAEGINAAKNDLIIFLDADIDPYPADTIKILSEPLLKDEADFVKGTFARNAGRVTELVAKPLLNIFYPGLSKFSQPLSGMIAGKKSYFNRIEFFNDYGVDVGILIDMYLMNARIVEVNIGYIENKSKPWEALGKMSKEVSRAIIHKAHHHLPSDFTPEEMESIEEINREMHNTLKENVAQSHKMVVFDMDDTILQGKFIETCADKFGFTEELHNLRNTEKDPIILTKRIGLLLRGRTIDELLQVVNEMQVVKDIDKVVAALKKKGYIVGIISYSYSLIANNIQQNIGADFSYANILEFFNGVATGEVRLPSQFFGTPDSLCGHAYCKTNALQFACEKYNVPVKNCIVVGDRCMVVHAGKGVAFRSKDELLNSIAYRTIHDESFEEILSIA